MVLGTTTIVIILTLLVFILSLSLYSRHSAQRDVRMLNNIAKKYGGQISVDSFNTSATMKFSRDGIDIRFYQRKGIGGKTTRCCLGCDIEYTAPLSVHIAKGISGDTSISELTHFLFVPKIAIGSERFVNEFIVHGSKKPPLAMLVTPEFEDQMLTLLENDPVLYLYPKGDGILKKDSSHSLEFSVGETPKDDDQLEALIENGLGIVRRFLVKPQEL